MILITRSLFLDWSKHFLKRPTTQPTQSIRDSLPRFNGNTYSIPISIVFSGQRVATEAQPFQWPIEWRLLDARGESGPHWNCHLWQRTARLFENSRGCGRQRSARNRNKGQKTAPTAELPRVDSFRRLLQCRIIARRSLWYSTRIYAIQELPLGGEGQHFRCQTKEEKVQTYFTHFILITFT